MLNEREREAQVVELQRQILNFGGTQPMEIDTAASRLGLSGQQVQEKIQTGEMIGLPFEGKMLIPSWQFNNQVLDPLKDLIRANMDDPWGLSDKLTSPQPNSGGGIPIEIMREGRDESFDYLMPEEQAEVNPAGQFELEEDIAPRPRTVNPEVEVFKHEAYGPQEPERSEMGSVWYPPEDLHAQRDRIANMGGIAAYTTAEVRSLLGIGTRQALSKRRRSGKVLGLPLGERNWVYPRWQFVLGGRLVPGLEAILEEAPIDDPWGVADVLTSAQETLGGRTPIEALQTGDEDSAREVRKIFKRIYS